MYTSQNGVKYLFSVCIFSSVASKYLLKYRIIKSASAIVCYRYHKYGRISNLVWFIGDKAATRSSTAQKKKIETLCLIDWIRVADQNTFYGTEEIGTIWGILLFRPSWFSTYVFHMLVIVLISASNIRGSRWLCDSIRASFLNEIFAQAFRMSTMQYT